MKQKFTIFAAISALGVASILTIRNSTTPAGDSPVAAAVAKTRSGSATAPGGSLSSSGKGERNAPMTAGATRSHTQAARRAQLESILSQLDLVDRQRALMSFLDKLSPDEIEEAVDQFYGLNLQEDYSKDRELILLALAKTNPAAALDHCKEEPNSVVTRSVLSAWTDNDPDAAIAWAEANNTGTEGNPFLIGIIQRLATRDPARATTLLAGMPGGESRDLALAGMMPSILAQGSRATRAWIDGLENESLRGSAIFHAITELADNDIKATLEWLAAKPDRAAAEQMHHVLGRWTIKDPAAAQAYYEALPSGETRSSALRGIVGKLVMSDPQAAAAFLDSHSADATDSAYMQFNGSSNYELAFSYIPKIKDPKARERCYRWKKADWLREDPAAAKAYFQANPSPDNMNVDPLKED